MLKCIFFNENLQISIKISLEFVPKGPIIPALVQIMAWCWPGDKPIFEPIMVKFEPIMVKYASLGLNELNNPFVSAAIQVTY